MIQLLAQVFAADDTRLTNRDLADLLWLLAARASDPRYLDGGEQEDPEVALPAHAGPSVSEAGADAESQNHEDPETSTPFYAAQGWSAETGLAASAIGLAHRGALPEPLAVARALRPFKRVREAGAPVIDLEATVDATAEARHFVVVSRPERRRRLDVALVVDDAPTVMLWHGMVREFQRTLEQVGAFRSVSRWYLGDDDGPCLRDSSGQRHAPQRLIDPSGRRLVLLVTDAVGQQWYSADRWTLVAQWSRAMPTAIVQTLPERYWRDSCLGDEQVAVRAPAPAVPNCMLSGRARKFCWG